MSAFTHGFSHGFFHGMFNGMFGGFNMFNNWCSWNSAPTFFTPSYSFGNFFQYQSPTLSMPAMNFSMPTMQMPMPMSTGIFSNNMPNVSPMNFNMNMSWQSFNGPSINCWGNFDTFSFSGGNSVKEEKDIVSQKDGDFDKMLKFVLSTEGGYNPNDCGQPGNKGVLQETYDSYRKNKGLSKRHVKEITDSEVKDLYYTMFYKASGADKIKDARMALYVFDSAVNMGVSAAKELHKKSGGDLDKFESLRITRYEKIAAKNNGKKQKYLKAWKNRVANVEKYANKEFAA